VTFIFVCFRHVKEGIKNIFKLIFKLKEIFLFIIRWTVRRRFIF